MKNEIKDILGLIQILRFGVSLGTVAPEIYSAVVDLVDEDGDVDREAMIAYLDELKDDLDEAQEELRAKLNA